jgi:predicted O-linked N-acetylglucosamine transferase (SPINDLY family)
VIIIVKKNNILIKLNSEKIIDSIDYDGIDVIFDLNDNTFVKGSIGFGVNGI